MLTVLSLCTQLERRIPRLLNFEDTWATAHLVQTKFNHRRGHQRQTQREEREAELAAALATEQMDLGTYHTNIWDGY